MASRDLRVTHRFTGRTRGTSSALMERSPTTVVESRLHSSVAGISHGPIARLSASKSGWPIPPCESLPDGEHEQLRADLQPGRFPRFSG